MLGQRDDVRAARHFLAVVNAGDCGIALSPAIAYIDDRRHDWIINMMMVMSTAMEKLEMKVSREQMAENRLRILDSASRLFREKGFDSVTVAEVMKAAGLTHGGFYGHFESKDDLVAQSLTRTLEIPANTELNLNTFIDSYLSPLHRDNPGLGCPTAGLVAETRHQAAPARAALTRGYQAQIDRMIKACPGQTEGDKRQQAIGTWAAVVGAVILARAIDNPELSDEVLQQTRAWIDAGPARAS